MLRKRTGFPAWIFGTTAESTASHGLSTARIQRPITRMLRTGEASIPITVTSCTNRTPVTNALAAVLSERFFQHTETDSAVLPGRPENAGKSRISACLSPDKIDYCIYIGYNSLCMTMGRECCALTWSYNDCERKSRMNHRQAEDCSRWFAGADRRPTKQKPLQGMH